MSANKMDISMKHLAIGVGSLKILVISWRFQVKHKIKNQIKREDILS